MHALPSNEDHNTVTEATPSVPQCYTMHQILAEDWSSFLDKPPRALYKRESPPPFSSGRSPNPTKGVTPPIFSIQTITTNGYYHHHYHHHHDPRSLG